MLCRILQLVEQCLSCVNTSSALAGVRGRAPQRELLTDALSSRSAARSACQSCMAGVLLHLFWQETGGKGPSIILSVRHVALTRIVCSLSGASSRSPPYKIYL